MGKQTPNGASIQERDIAKIMLKKEFPLVGPGPRNPLPNRESLDQPPLPRAWEEVNQRHEQVRLHGEPAIRSLHKIPDADAGDLFSKLLVAERVPQVLHHGGAETYI